MERVEVMTAVPPSFQGGHRTRKLSLQTLSSKPCLCIRTIVWPAICCAWCDFILIWYCTNYIYNYPTYQHYNIVPLFLAEWLPNVPGSRDGTICHVLLAPVCCVYVDASIVQSCLGTTSESKALLHTMCEMAFIDVATGQANQIFQNWIGACPKTGVSSDFHLPTAFLTKVRFQ